jgi:hypothetical protein
VDEVAREVAAAVEAAGFEYALGGAIALSYWAGPRGTLDVDVTLFIPATQPTTCVRLLQSIGCTLDASRAIASLAEHNFCQIEFGGRRLDVFLPNSAFYEEARSRRRQVKLVGQGVWVWDAETLCVFKMMFFRLKDLADVEEILRVQGDRLDRGWVLRQILAIYGQRDPRAARWEELVRETGGRSASTGP